MTVTFAVTARRSRARGPGPIMVAPGSTGTVTLTGKAKAASLPVRSGAGPVKVHTEWPGGRVTRTAVPRGRRLTGSAASGYHVQVPRAAGSTSDS